VETKRFVGSNVNLILTRQTCGQHSSRAAESKHRALALCFSIRIRCTCQVSTYRRKLDLGLSTTFVPAKRMPLQGGDFRYKNVFGRKFVGISEIFKKLNFKLVKWQSTFIWNVLSQAELETEGLCLATIFGLPPTPPHGVWFGKELYTWHFLINVCYELCRCNHWVL